MRDVGLSMIQVTLMILIHQKIQSTKMILIMTETDGIHIMNMIEEITGGCMKEGIMTDTNMAEENMIEWSMTGWNMIIGTEGNLIEERVITVEEIMIPGIMTEGEVMIEGRATTTEMPITVMGPQDKEEGVMMITELPEKICTESLILHILIHTTVDAVLLHLIETVLLMTTHRLPTPHIIMAIHRIHHIHHILILDPWTCTSI